MGSSETILRLQKEFQDIKRNGPSFCTAGPKNRNLFQWEASIAGPPGTPYEHHFFSLEIVFPVEFPRYPPVVKFVTQIYHMNVHSSGKICLDILGRNWKEEINVSNMLMAICNLLANPNPDDPFCRQKGNEYKTDKAKYLKTAKEMTQKYARPF